MSCPRCKDWYWTVCNECRGVPDKPERQPAPPRPARTARQEDRAAGEELDRMARALYWSGYDPNACYYCGGRMRPANPDTGAWARCTSCGRVESEAG